MISDNNIEESAERYLLVTLGLMFKTKLWMVVIELKAGRQLNILADRNTFMTSQEVVRRLHMARYWRGSG